MKGHIIRRIGLGILAVVVILTLTGITEPINEVSEWFVGGSAILALFLILLGIRKQNKEYKN